MKEKGEMHVNKGIWVEKDVVRDFKNSVVLWFQMNVVQNFKNSVVLWFQMDVVRDFKNSVVRQLLSWIKILGINN